MEGILIVIFLSVPPGLLTTPSNDTVSPATVDLVDLLVRVAFFVLPFVFLIGAELLLLECFNNDGITGGVARDRVGVDSEGEICDTVGTTGVDE